MIRTHWYSAPGLAVFSESADIVQPFGVPDFCASRTALRYSGRFLVFFQYRAARPLLQKSGRSSQAGSAATTPWGRPKMRQTRPLHTAE